LLPQESVGEDGEEVDPRAELVARLLEYQRFKEAADKLGDRPRLGRDVFDVRQPDLAAVPESEREIEVGLFELVEAYKSAIAEAASAPKAHEIEVDPVTVHERMIVLMEALEGSESLEFEQVLRQPDGTLPSRAVIVTSFLAILELTRLAALRIYQSVNVACVPVGPIHLRRIIAPGDSGWEELIADVM
jgi:segregation and condensation protein A